MDAAQIKQFQNLGIQSAEMLLARSPAQRYVAQNEMPKWLVQGAIHEWYLEMPSEVVGWFPPLTVVTELAKQVILAHDYGQKQLVWVGRSCWPTFQMLITPSEGIALLKRCVFLDPLTQAEKIWSIAEALRCPAVGLVIADGSEIDVTASRRLQLAAETGTARAFITRPIQEQIKYSSWATTQWVVRPEASEGSLVQWDIELVRSRGRHIRQDASCHWIFSWTYEVLRGTSTFHLSARVGHTAHTTSRQIRAG